MNDKKEWTEEQEMTGCKDGLVIARVTLQIVIDVPDGVTISDAVKQLIHSGVHDAFCVEILSGEPTNLSAKELIEKSNLI